jgi:hypothetical protein
MDTLDRRDPVVDPALQRIEKEFVLISGTVLEARPKRTGSRVRPWHMVEEVRAETLADFITTMVGFMFSVPTT